MKLLKYLLETAVFICGAVVMIFELVGSRVLGPYFGTSIFVWSTLIGVILGSLSLGYFIGGKVADKKPRMIILASIIFIAAVFIALTLFIKSFVLNFLQIRITDIRISSVIASLVLFLPTSVLLGMVSPYAAKLKLHDLNVSGRIIGNLYAISTAGSIFGTFLAGFYLIPHFGTNKLLSILSFTLIIISAMLFIKNTGKTKLFVFLCFALCLTGINAFGYFYRKAGFIDVDTGYNRVWIYDYTDAGTNKPVRIMRINNINSSSMFLNSDELANEYTKYYHLVKHFNPGFKNTLMLGGAGYSYPKDFLLKYPEATIDVVEIDPMVTGLAKKYFKLKDNSRLTIFHEDGRVFLNTTKKKYDAIFGDAFTSHHSVPYQLTTQEAVQKKFDILNDNGVVILNIIASLKGGKSRFLKAESATYKSIFPQVFLFPVSDPGNETILQNVILVALKSNNPQSFTDADPQLNGFLQHVLKKGLDTDMPVLTDDFAPVDYYTSSLIF